jgi:hypothetical protein
MRGSDRKSAAALVLSSVVRAGFRNETLGDATTRSLDEGFVDPVTAVVTPPNLSDDETARDRPTRNQNLPQVPGLSPCGFRAQTKHLQIRRIVRRHL